jgi:hypothetical protein
VHGQQQQADLTRGRTTTAAARAHGPMARCCCQQLHCRCIHPAQERPHQLSGHTLRCSESHTLRLAHSLLRLALAVTRTHTQLAHRQSDSTRARTPTKGPTALPPHNRYQHNHNERFTSLHKLPAFHTRFCAHCTHSSDLQWQQHPAWRRPGRACAPAGAWWSATGACWRGCAPLW